MACLITAFAECDIVFMIGVIFGYFALAWTDADVLGVIGHLKITMFFNDPYALFPDKGTHDCLCIFIVIMRRKNIANIVHKS